MNWARVPDRVATGAVGAAVVRGAVVVRGAAAVGGADAPRFAATKSLYVHGSEASNGAALCDCAGRRMPCTVPTDAVGKADRLCDCARSSTHMYEHT